MDTSILVTALVGNIPALLILYWCTQERKERIDQFERLYRLLLAVAGFKTEPDSQNIVRIQPDRDLAGASQEKSMETHVGRIRPE